MIAKEQSLALDVAVPGKDTMFPRSILALRMNGQI
jgi:hypothetical protein